MSLDNWDKIKEIYFAADELAPGAEREIYLREVCGGDEDLRGEVEKLLDHDEAENVMSRPLLEASGVHAFAQMIDDLDPLLGRQIGAYRLVSEIGRGGMGAVYLASRADGEFKQNVAVKLIKRGMDSAFIVRRFRHERQILASFDHPNIARLLDGGTTGEGLPYFVMEYIEGDTLYDFCDKKRLTIRERLEIFRQICAAVAYAHERGIVHRDLKPSNIMFTSSAIPKLLDFGIAKILDSELIHESINPTASMMRLMTPDYASPEQICGSEVTFSSDIYSLGVLLYELLTGHRPYHFKGRALHEVSRVICETAPPTTGDVLDKDEYALHRYENTPQKIYETRRTTKGELQKTLRRDLNEIVLKSLAKDAADRYNSVNEFAEDIRRFLNGEPITVKNFSPNFDTFNGKRAANLATQGKSLAVLPFKFLSLTKGEDTGDEFLGIGLADALIARLSRVKSLVVRPTGSILGFSEGGADPISAARQLDVDYILDGSIKKAGERLRVSVQLLNVAENSTVWATSIDEKTGDLFSLEDALSTKVVEALLPQLTGVDLEDFQKRGTENAEAFEQYLRGRYYFNIGTEEGFAKAFVSFHQAIAFDSEYARAHAGLAAYYTWLGIYGVLPPRECLPLAIKAAEKAVALDVSLAEAHAILGFAVHAGNYDHRRAVAHLTRSLELNPNYAEAYAWLAIIRFTEARFQEGLMLAERAVALDPLTPYNHHNISWGLYYARRFDEGIRNYRQAVRDFPDYGLNYYGLSKIFRFLGKTAEAEKEVLTARKIFGDSAFILFSQAETYAAAGHAEKAHRIIENLNDFAAERYVSPYQFALVYCYLKDKETALAKLSEAEKIGEPWLNWITVEPVFDFLREDARFQELSAKFQLYADGKFSDRRESQPESSTEIKADAANPKTGDLHEAVTVVMKSGKPRRFSKLYVASLIIAVLFAVAGLSVYWLKSRGVLTVSFTGKDPINEPAAQKNSLAVLPFVNETGSPENDFLTDGLSDNLINRLSNLSAIRVLSRAAAFKYKSSAIAPQKAGEELNVETVLSGRLTRHDGNVEIYAELVDVKNNSVIWKKQYNRPDSEIIALQNQIADDVGAQFKGAANDQKQTAAKTYTNNTQAFEFYLKGEFERQKSTPDGIKNAIDFYRKALEIDANYALAFQGLALAYRSAPAYGTLLPPEAYPLAKESALKALSIDPTLGTAYVPLASMKATYEWDFAGAEKDYKQAIQFVPNNAEAHYSYGNFLVSQGRSEEGLNELRIAQQFDPLSANAATNIGWALYIAGRFDEAEMQIKQVIARDPTFARAYMNLGEIYEEEGKFDQAIEMIQKSKQLSNDSLAEMALGHAYAMAGRKAEAVKIAQELEAKVLKKEVSPFLPAVVYAGLKENDKAFYWLERAFQERSNWLSLAKIGRRLKPLRSDPRFDDLLKRIGFN